MTSSTSSGSSNPNSNGIANPTGGSVVNNANPSISGNVLNTISSGLNGNSISVVGSVGQKSSASHSSVKKETISALSKQDVIISQQGHSYSKQEIRDIQNTIERGLTCYRSKMEIFSVLKNVDQNVVNLVWQKLEQNNPRFFTAYLMRLAVIKQVKVFQQLMIEQNKLKHSQMKGPSSNNSSMNIQASSSANTNVVANPNVQNNLNAPLMNPNPYQLGSHLNSHTLPNTHPNQVIPNMNIFQTNLISPLDQGRRGSLSNINTPNNTNILSVNSTRFQPSMMQFNQLLPTMQPIGFGGNQSFAQNAMTYQGSNFGQMGSLIGQGGDQQFNSYAGLNSFTLGSNQGMTPMSTNNGFSITQQSSHKSNSKSDMLEDGFP